MANKKSGRNIEIQRNVIEQYIMTARDFVRGHSKAVKTVSIAVLVAVAVGVAADFAYTHFSSKDNIHNLPSRS